MIAVQLEKDEWDRVMGIIAQAPWNVANPLLMKIGQQVQAHQGQQAKTDPLQEQYRLQAAQQQPDPLAVQRKLQAEAGTFMTEEEWKRLNGGRPRPDV